jgi:tetrahydromethanopterin S-methyltransferase subunit G
MKETTKKIYDLVTSEKFNKIEEFLKEVVENNSWEDTIHQEFTYQDLLYILPESLSIIKVTIEEENVFDNILTYNDRNSIYDSLNSINSSLTNMENGTAQLPNVMVHTELIYSLIIKNQLNYKTENIPFFTAKINQYKELNKKLEDLVKGLEKTELNQNNYNELIDKINKTIGILSEYESKAEKDYNEIFEKNSSIDTIKKDSEEKFETISQVELNINSSYEEIMTVKNNSNKFFEKVEEYISKMNSSEEKTQNLIEKNNVQTIEIDKQLEKAVGVSLFHTFAARRKQLNPTTWSWLVVIVLSVISIVYLSSDIITGFNAMNHISETTNNNSSTVVNTIVSESTNNNVNWIWLTLKITLTFPLIYLIAFATTRYSKERRLMEEYAFKSSVSLALKPYSDLVIKLGKEGNDPEHRKFLIDTINNIFATPTDKVFGSKEKNVDFNSFDLKELNSLLESLNKLKSK